MSDKQRLPISVRFSETGLGPDDSVKVGDLQLTPGLLPITGIAVNMQVGQPATMVIDVAPHNGWSVDATGALVKLRELVQVETIQDMRTSEDRQALHRIATRLRDIAEGIGNVTPGGDIFSLAREIDDVARKL